MRTPLLSKGFLQFYLFLIFFLIIPYLNILTTLPQKQSDQKRGRNLPAVVKLTVDIVTRL